VHLEFPSTKGAREKAAFILMNLQLDDERAR
jgi:hypothetical protein